MIWLGGEGNIRQEETRAQYSLRFAGDSCSLSFGGDRCRLEDESEDRIIPLV